MFICVCSRCVRTYTRTDARTHARMYVLCICKYPGSSNLALSVRVCTLCIVHEQRIMAEELPGMFPEGSTDGRQKVIQESSLQRNIGNGDMLGSIELEALLREQQQLLQRGIDKWLEGWMAAQRTFLAGLVERRLTVDGAAALGSTAVCGNGDHGCASPEGDPGPPAASSPGPFVATAVVAGQEQLQPLQANEPRTPQKRKDLHSNSFNSLNSGNSLKAKDTPSERNRRPSVISLKLGLSRVLNKGSVEGNAEFRNESSPRSMASLEAEGSISRRGSGLSEVAPAWDQAATSEFNKFLKSQSREVTLDQLWRYELCTAVLVLIDATAIGWQVQFQAQHGRPHRAAAVCRTLMCSAFVVELVVRLILRGRGFFRPPNMHWNIFDSVIITLSAVQELISRTTEHDTALLAQLTLLRVLRMIRLWRVLRILRKLEMCRELRMLMSGITRACRSLLWAGILLACMFYIFGVSLTSGSLGHCNTAAAVSTLIVDPLCLHFGTVGDSMLTLYQAMSGGILWSELVDALQTIQYPIPYTVILVLCVSIAQFVVANIVAGSILAVVLQTTRREQEDLINDEIQDRKMCYRHMHDMFQLMDISNNGSVSLMEFKIALSNERVAAFFSALKIDTTDLNGLFELLDRGGTGAVELDDFILSCLWIKG